MTEPNPYKVTSGLQGNCLKKAGVSYVVGGAMGLVMAMFMNAVEMREIELGKVKRSTRIVLRKDWRRIKGTGKGFAAFGGIFVFYECMIEHVRTKDDSFNSFLAGAATSIVLAARSRTLPMKDMMWTGLGGGVMCAAFYKVFKLLGY